MGQIGAWSRSGGVRTADTYLWVRYGTAGLDTRKGGFLGISLSLVSVSFEILRCWSSGVHVIQHRLIKLEPSLSLPSSLTKSPRWHDSREPMKAYDTSLAEWCAIWEGREDHFD
ncbi:hypothetical protein VNO77_19007 [Canavalia gladiata]|uniref:Uncharacterized protein n=1 Tax=Canavalia gladiata TaxID=3824 RepID=A0AAN9LLQ9_CANGL